MAYSILRQSDKDNYWVDLVHDYYDNSAVYGYGGNDTFWWRSGNDRLYGMKGNDAFLFDVGFADDTQLDPNNLVIANGGKGHDMFFFRFDEVADLDGDTFVVNGGKGLDYLGIDFGDRDYTIEKVTANHKIIHVGDTSIEFKNFEEFQFDLMF